MFNRAFPIILLLTAFTSAFLSCSHQGEKGRALSSEEGDAGTPEIPAPPSLGATSFLDGPAVGMKDRHVLLMHLDGFHGEVFKNLLQHNQLPNFAFLLSRGKITFSNSTVDKSETMKVIQSYLTSQIDTEIVGWWQFQKEDFKYYNTWIDPAGVIDYALGVRYPRFPTLIDFLTSKGERSFSGFALHRRGVAFHDYFRNYKEGLKGAFQHTYFDQAHTTMTGLRGLFRKMAEQGERIPRFTHALLAPADEWGHLLGVVTDEIAVPAGKDEVTYCLNRSGDEHSKMQEILFSMVEKEVGTSTEEDDGPASILVDKGFQGGKIVPLKGAGHFTGLTRSFWGKLSKMCVRLPVVETYSDPLTIAQESLPVNKIPKNRKVVHPSYALGMIMVDIELGHLINTLRAVRPQCQESAPCFAADMETTLEEYINQGQPEHSLFENTLFAFTGDHGMADSKAQMLPCGEGAAAPCEKERSPYSFNKSFIEVLNEKLALATPNPTQVTAEKALVGVDDTLLPKEVLAPFTDPSWQSAEVKKTVQEALAWSEGFYQDIYHLLKSELSSKYWWLLYLKEVLVYPKLAEKLDGFKERATLLFTDVYLRAVPSYVAAEREYLRSFYERHVRLVYGGGARNNAELFIPHIDKQDQGAHWDQRPSYDEIVEYRPATSSSKTLLQTVLDNPGTGLVFIRQNNASFKKGTPPPPRTDIMVMDKMGRKGMIRVQREKNTEELIYGYRPLTDADPLGYADLKKDEWTFGTYSEWNERSVGHQHYYHNAVAGMGSYLYSSSDAIGDMVATHSQGWCYGDNLGGHGGIHRDEKLTVMMVSGPGISYGRLMGRKSLQTLPQGSGGEEFAVASYPEGKGPLTPTTALDLAPTILSWLGYGETALGDFSQSREFKDYLQKWVGGQEEDIMNHLDDVDNLKEALSEAGLGNVKIGKLKERLRRFFQFMPKKAPMMAPHDPKRPMGNLLQL